MEEIKRKLRIKLPWLYDFLKSLYKKTNTYKNKMALEKKILSLDNNKERFEYIYKTKWWGSKESVSGLGSTLNFTKSIRQHLPKIFTQFNISKVLDAPCGDFNWMQHVLKDCNDINYKGGDIVSALIDENNEKYSTDNISFVILDITKDSLPDADLIIVRDCLFHLSYSDISLFLQNLSKSNIKYILTTGHASIGDIRMKNSDINTGSYRDINLFVAPFSWTKEFLFEIKEKGRSLYLFECAQLPSNVDLII